MVRTDLCHTLPSPSYRGTNWSLNDIHDSLYACESGLATWLIHAMNTGFVLNRNILTIIKKQPMAV